MLLDEPLRRGTYIGGHDAVAVVGLHPHLSRVDVWRRMTGRVPADTARPSPAMMRGLICEPGILEYVHREHHALVRDARGSFASFFVDDDVPFFAGSPDGLTKDGRGIIEVTTCTSRNRHLWGAEGTDQVAKHKGLQAQWYMGITGRHVAHVYCFAVDSDELLRYVVPRRDPAIDVLRDSAEQFWLDHVVEGIIPPPDAAVSDELATALWPKATRPETQATPEIIELATRYAHARDLEKTAAATKEESAIKLKLLLKDAAKCVWDGGSIHYTSSKLKPSVDWNLVASKLATQFGVDEAAMAKLTNECTVERNSARSLRVFLTGRTEEIA
jgi:putative phage-type endonuclease